MVIRDAVDCVREDGRKEGRLSVARKPLAKGMEVATIAEVTGLSEAEIAGVFRGSGRLCAGAGALLRCGRPHGDIRGTNRQAGAVH